ncbi:MAG TPA: hypothetical protein VFE35_09305 [Candidatus Cybelea sp.]|jgi:glutathione synthase/RimK-type ligase-like ATP-grasp enzyme|nr:hypothetical protein [Candidatus Cybelea sp.]
MIDCTLVTCEAKPTLDPDDRILLLELRKRRLSVSIAVWNDPQVDWRASRLCVLRSTWDYYRHYGEFITWLARAAGATTLRNDPSLVRWNAHKSYLRDLERAGVPVVPTVWINQGESRRLAELSELLGSQDLVIKPARGAATHGVLLVRNEGAALMMGQAHLNTLSRTQDVLVQPYVETVVTHGERALIFLDGRFSHAVVKKPFDTALAIRDARSALVSAAPDELSVASKALAAVPGAPLYARVDLIHDLELNARVSEVELIEPGLYLGAHVPASITFADAIERELRGRMGGLGRHRG